MAIQSKFDKKSISLESKDIKLITILKKEKLYKQVLKSSQPDQEGIKKTLYLVI